MDRISVEKYRELFPSPATNSWKLEVRDGCWVVHTPNRYHFIVNKEAFGADAFWDEVYAVEHTSTRLWVRSIWYASLLAEQGEFELAQYVVQSYHRFLRNRDLDPKRFGMNSLDHCLAINVRACVQIIEAFRDDSNAQELVAAAE